MTDAMSTTTRPLVSVLIITYNQQEFICQAIQSVVEQVTEFPFEIILADDCSTDGTWDACLEAQMRYPDLISLIRPKKNLGINGNFQFALSRSVGDFIAICEGDDFWIDETKLQRQVAALEDHPTVDLAITGGEAHYLNSKRSRALWSRWPSAKIVPVNEFFSGYAMPAPTASLLWRTEVTKRLPDWFDEAKFADQLILMAASCRGGAYYDPAVTVVYRVSAPNSFTVALGKLGTRGKAEACRGAIAVLENGARFFGFPRSAIAHRISDTRTRLVKLLLNDRQIGNAVGELIRLPPTTMAKVVVRTAYNWLIGRERIGGDVF